MSGRADAGLDELRHELAEQHGLGPDAVSFLNGETVAEIEGQAVQLAELLGARREPEPERAENVLARAFAHDARRRRAVADIITGRAQRRDTRGRFTGRPKPGSLDAGARTPPPLPPPTHDQWLIHVLSQHRTTGVW